jgi:LPXTG-motif cell wall-anchored protein
MHHRHLRRRACASALIVLALQGATLVSPGAASAQERPGFQLPFPCDEQWRLDSWGHAPALDMVKEPNQEGTEGAQLVASAAGVVNESFFHSNAGNVVQIDHGGGWFTTYLHLESRSVEVGAEVGRGQEIGRVGRTGPTSNDHPHLHFELAVDENGDGEASWGFSGSERVRPQFDGVEYGQSNNQTWRDVTSNNCGQATPVTTVAETTTTAPAPTTTVPESTTTVPAPTTTAPAPTTTGPAPTTSVPETTTTTGETLPVTGSRTGPIAAVGATLLAVGAGALALARRRRMAH